MMLTCYLVNPAETILLELVQSLSKVREGWERALPRAVSIPQDLPCYMLSHTGILTGLLSCSMKG